MKNMIIIFLMLGSCTTLPKETTREKDPARLEPIVERDTPSKREEQYLLYAIPAIVAGGWLLFKLLTEKDGENHA